MYTIFSVWYVQRPANCDCIEVSLAQAHDYIRMWFCPPTRRWHLDIMCWLVLHLQHIVRDLACQVRSVHYLVSINTTLFCNARRGVMRIKFWTFHTLKPEYLPLHQYGNICPVKSNWCNIIECSELWTQKALWIKAAIYKCSSFIITIIITNVSYFPSYLSSLSKFGWYVLH